MADVRSGSERQCTFKGCNGRMRAGALVEGELPPPSSHWWMCNVNTAHTITCLDSDIAEEDILPPGV